MPSTSGAKQSAAPHRSAACRSQPPYPTTCLPPPALRSGCDPAANRWPRASAVRSRSSGPARCCRGSSDSPRSGTQPDPEAVCSRPARPAHCRRHAAYPGCPAPPPASAPPDQPTRGSPAAAHCAPCPTTVESHRKSRHAGQREQRGHDQVIGNRGHDAQQQHRRADDHIAEVVVIEVAARVPGINRPGRSCCAARR